MSAVNIAVMDGQLVRQAIVGDTVMDTVVLPATDVANTKTIGALDILRKYILRTQTGNATDTMDTAANLINGITQSLNSGISRGSSIIVRWVNLAAFTITVQATANTGVTVTRGALASSVSKDFLITFANVTPAQTYAAMTTNASATVSGLSQAQLSTLSPGMIVTNAVNGLQGTTILGVNVTAGTLTMSGNANATSVSPGVAISFSPVVLVEGLAA